MTNNTPTYPMWWAVPGRYAAPLSRPARDT